MVAETGSTSVRLDLIVVGANLESVDRSEQIGAAEHDVDVERRAAIALVVVGRRHFLTVGLARDVVIDASISHVVEVGEDLFQGATRSNLRCDSSCAAPPAIGDGSDVSMCDV